MTTAVNYSSSLPERLQDWAWGGIDLNVVELGGLECKYHVSAHWRLAETLVGFACAALSLWIGLGRGRPGPTAPSSPRPCCNGVKYSPARSFLLVVLSITFGLELGFKFVTRTVIFALYPCHVVTACWIFLLASPPSFANGFHTFLYRCTLHYTHGTITAILFPIDHDLHMPFERETYWIQHYLLLLIPLYMIYFERGAYSLPERVTNSSSGINYRWVFISFGIWSLWHWGVMQGVSYVTLTNVGHMLCPAVTDPFAGPFYRLIGIAHQFLATVISAGLIALLRAGEEREEGEEQVVVTRPEVLETTDRPRTKSSKVE